MLYFSLCMKLFQNRCIITIQLNFKFHKQHNSYLLLHIQLCLNNCDYFYHCHEKLIMVEMFNEVRWNDWDRQNMRWLTSRTLSVPWSCFIASCRSVSLTWGNSSTPLWIRKHLNPATPAWTIGLSSSWDGWTEMDWQADKHLIVILATHSYANRWG